jgi:hypothetical protein
MKNLFYFNFNLHDLMISFLKKEHNITIATKMVLIKAKELQ